MRMDMFFSDLWELSCWISWTSMSASMPSTLVSCPISAVIQLDFFFLLPDLLKPALTIISASSLNGLSCNYPILQHVGLQFAYATGRPGGTCANSSACSIFAAAKRPWRGLGGNGSGWTAKYRPRKVRTMIEAVLLVSSIYWYIFVPWRVPSASHIYSTGLNRHLWGNWPFYTVKGDIITFHSPLWFLEKEWGFPLKKLYIELLDTFLVSLNYPCCMYTCMVLLEWVAP